MYTSRYSIYSIIQKNKALSPLCMGILFFVRFALPLIPCGPGRPGGPGGPGGPWTPSPPV